jgi:ankyrin repeat protein
LLTVLVVAVALAAHGQSAYGSDSPEGAGKMFEAARDGDVEGLKTQHELKVPVNSTNETGRTALMLAALNGHVEAVTFLIAHGANWRAKDSTGQNAKHLALSLQKADVARAIDQASSDVLLNSPDIFLCCAVALGNAAFVRQALEKGANVNAVIRASTIGDRASPVSKRIFGEIEAGELMRKTDPLITPLMLAASGKAGFGGSGHEAHTELLGLLLDKGANPNVTNERGESALDLVAEAPYPAQDKRRSLLEGKGGLRGEAIAAGQEGLVDALIKAVQKTDFDMIQAAISQGADPNYGRQGMFVEQRSALICAIKAGSDKVVDYLLSKGADPNKALTGSDGYDEPGRTPLHYAAMIGTVGMVKTLLEKGAKVDAQNLRQGMTPLMMAAQRTNASEVVDLLIKAGSEANAKNKEGDTPLSLALKGRADGTTIEALVDGGADVDLETTRREIPLMLAAETKSDEIVAILAEKVTKQRSRDFALFSAALKGRASTVELLLKKGADPNAKDSAGRTAMFFANQGKSELVVGALERAGAKDVPRRGPDLSPVDPTKLTRAAWRKVLGPFNFSEGGPTILSEAAFKQKFGNPVQTQQVGDEGIWYYKCSDGICQVVIETAFLQQNKLIIKALNDY